MTRGGDRQRVKRSVLDRVDDGVLGVDTDLRIEYLNERAETVLSDVADEVLGQRVWEVIPATAGTEVESAIRTAFETQESQSFEWYSDPTGRHFEVRLFPDETGVTIYFADITDRTQEAREIESRTEQLTALVENTDAAIYIKDIDGRLEFVNHALADLFGRDPEVIVGEYDTDLFDEETAAEIRDIDDTIAETGVPDVREAERVINGDRRVFLENTYPYRSADGDILGVMGISHDITEIAEREADLQRKHDRLDEFASVLSHDILNPLSIAQGRLTLAREDVDSDHLEDVETALERIQTIAADTLTLARNGEVVTTPEPVGITDVAAKGWAMVGADTATLAIDDEFTVLADPDRLLHVFENLFKNAVTHAGTKVTVHLGRLEDGFYVEDDGPGIPADARNAVFEAGHRSESGGTGFGLTIVKRIVDAHGWTISITDGTEGGARFEFRGVDVSD